MYSASFACCDGSVGSGTLHQVSHKPFKQKLIQFLSEQDHILK